MTTILVIILLISCVWLAIRSLRKQKGCGSGCSGCAHAQGCPAKSIQQFVDESKRRKVK